ncbi:protein tyrosine phosphatase family protein [Qipengyuania sp. DSG2-2]|uniref:protein tyrosine phosphatase family protein n=1 Tax=Qipengyuania sp. DGS2-2 TaxID=3349631 RepID=UPI0036D2A5B1
MTGVDGPLPSGGNAEPSDIRAWQRLSDDVTTSGKLEAGDPARLAAIGVRNVINLALDNHPEALADEAALLAEQGIGYTHIPVPFDAPSPDDYAAFCQAIETAEGPVHVHCIMNYRVSAFFYLLHLEQGMDEAAAHALMAEQWDPASADHPAAKPWGDLIVACANPPRKSSAPAKRCSGRR